MKVIVTLGVVWFSIVFILVCVGPSFSQKIEPYGPNFFQTTFRVLTIPITIPVTIYSHRGSGMAFGENPPYRPRFVNWAWANWGGYFWLPCPICEQNFGGHEPSGTLMKTQGSGTSVCRNCVDEAEKRNKVKYKERAWG